ncbi:MAG: DUF805 domain-containing protein [Inquilinus sp.]|nr:DUF805 domain-containing protein [Inquilinus sp.]
MRRSSFSLMWFLFSFQGRIGRFEYWMYTFGSWVVAAVVVHLAAEVVFQGPAGTKVEFFSNLITYGIVLLVGTIALCLTGCAVVAKRWHDRNRSGYWSLIMITPFASLFTGPVPLLSDLLTLCFVAGGLWTLLECGGLKGTVGPNRFGDDPRGPPSEQPVTAFK